MKNNYLISIRAIALLLMTTLFVQCTEIPDGYIPDKVVYVQNPFVVQQGVEITTSPPNINGASYPLRFRLLESEGPDGKMTTVLTDSVETRIWTKPYDYTTDKTIEAINAKITTVKVPVMRISGSGGQISFSSSSSIIPPGEYKVSVEMSNSAGTKAYKNVFTASIVKGETYQLTPSDTYSWNTEKGAGSWNKPEEAAKYDVQQDASGKSEIILIICDKNGNPFDWKNGEVITRGSDRGSFESLTFGQPIYTNEKATYEYPFAPFPFAPGGINQYNYYYRILGSYVKYDDPAQGGFMNLTFNFRALSSGKWTVKITYPGITRIPKR